ncbi:pyruvate carboxylase [Flavilitoribacter nigricans]|uniref:Pyruvate carboxylase n=1 Tax=Flavilitoribacter nigricans (strain ATCC 23147 / DSM 23189 / NBRC 102662 / NCIMB 1420 / SS-2) TaxID=1122177 RepID=A0A2D0NJ14_FLAN2|nr:pyruvate carboxylase [Flavilitoribacter nigricans DSM 23189 = NBRC 102662]
MTYNVKKFKRILVANRGEIAIRVLRAAAELNLRTIAIYTYEDRYSLHRYKADEAYQIGSEDEPLKPYLDIDEIIRLAKDKNVDAIHPGYGFLSENVHFARKCEEAGIEFIGPPAEVMEQLGDKVAAKKLARRVEVPLIEDSRQDLTSADIALEEARRIGFPVIIKAAAGGGGRGMRVVRDEKNLKVEYQEASGEAMTAFGDGTVFLEKFIENPKHIEVQILGDKHGNIVHLFERDCSVQRRFQKVVEIAPCVTLSQDTKDKLYDYALRLTREVGYSFAGTVEFLVDQDENIYFIEVNPRVQVEHTITEQVTGVDIVRSQILIGMGYALSNPEIDIQSQEDVKLSGCAIQCRVTTEDPTLDFKPDYGTLIAYRSAAGMGIRLDAGSAFPGAKISPYFDSMLVKVTSWGRNLPGAAQRLHRALREFRIRGVKTNIGFLLNLLRNETFQSGEATVNFIKENPDLLEPPNWRDRSTKMLLYLADVIVNDNPDVKSIDESVVFIKPEVPAFDRYATLPKGTKDKLTELGPEAFAKWLKSDPSIHYTDTTFRDAHQSLLATRMRTYDMMQVAESYAHHMGDQVFSMEMWGGATFDVSMRFLKEDPWRRLTKLRQAIPNVLFQMLLRGSNAVGYTAYPDNLVIKFVEEAAEAGIDIFRIFDSLNWVEAMQVSIRTVRERTNSIAEACICYTGDITDPARTKFTLDYYLDLAKRLEDEGAHILAIKDMAGLLKPLAAEQLITALKETVDLPIHLHTHDTSSIQAATYMKAIEVGVDVVDVAISSMSGLTSQPNFNSLVAMMKGYPKEREINFHALNQFSNYWEAVRRYYYPFETELRAGTAEVYEHEIPGGQYSNLRPQARALGLEEQFETIKANYKAANELFGDLIKVTPSSKVVGDMAMFMTANGLSKEDVIKKGSKLSFPDSVKALMRGDLGQIDGGFPADIQHLILKDEKPYTDRPNAHLDQIDFDAELADFRSRFDEDLGIRDFLAYRLYPKVYQEYFEFQEMYGTVANLPTKAFFYGLKPNEEIIVTLSPGKNVLIKYLNMTEPDELGNRLVIFQLNGQTRSVPVRDKNARSEVVMHRKASGQNEIGAPLQGNLSKILVEEGDEVTMNTPLFIIEAMKMESTITSPIEGTVTKIFLTEKTLVEQDDLVLEVK